MSRGVGTVFLVGAGPGDPGLITVRGLAILRSADVVIHDRLIPLELLAEVRPGTEIIDVGKVHGAHAIKQSEINSILITKARSVRVVVRLKGGDPYVFGRGYEELQACRAAGVPCHVIPGITSALAGPAAAGIPVTDRTHARSFAVVSARSAGDRVRPDLNYEALAGVETVVVLMGREKLRDVVQGMLRAGRSAETPVALVEWATTPRQRVLVSSLAEVADQAERAEFAAPIVTIIGEAARCADQSCNQATLPLSGRRIVLTRPDSSATEMSMALTAAGAFVVACPLIRIVQPDSAPELDAALARLTDYSWLVFTSQHGVRAFHRRLRRSGRDARALANLRVAVVGPATARALRRLGIKADLMPGRYTGEALAEALVRCAGPNAGRVLYPRADIASTKLARALRAQGFDVADPAAYHTVPAEPPPAVRQILQQGVDAILFCSPSAVHQFADQKLPLGRAAIACIGPVTAAAARQRGLLVEVVARDHSTEGLVTALCDRFAAVRNQP